MAFSVTVEAQDIFAVSLTDGNPFRLAGGSILESAAIVRYQQNSPLQSGVNDLGFHLQPRDIELRILFWAATGALLDDYRDLLMQVFRPYRDVTLTATLDNGTQRKLTCQAVSAIQIDFLPEEDPGHLHRATVVLRASSPVWRATSTAIGSVDYSTAISQWWLAGGAIDAAQVKTHVENPAPFGQNWTGVGTGIAGGHWAVAVVTAYNGTTPAETFDRVVWSDNSVAILARMAGVADGTRFRVDYSVGGISWPGGTSYNYHLIQDTDNGRIWWYWNGSAVAINHADNLSPINLSGTGRWGNAFGSPVQYGWDEYILKAMIFADPTTEQIAALAPYMLGSAVKGSTSVVNDGDVDAYPYITLRGPISDPVIINESAGGTIDLTGISIPENAVYTLDLRTGDKRLTDSGGNNVLDAVTTPPLGMANFRLAPAPLAPGGTNTISVTPGSVGTATYVTIQATNGYVSL